MRCVGMHNNMQVRYMIKHSKTLVNSVRGWNVSADKLSHHRILRNNVLLMTVL